MPGSKGWSTGYQVQKHLRTLHSLWVGYPPVSDSAEWKSEASWNRMHTAPMLGDGEVAVVGAELPEAHWARSLILDYYGDPGFRCLLQLPCCGWAGGQSVSSLSTCLCFATGDKQSGLEDRPACDGANPTTVAGPCPACHVCVPSTLSYHHLQHSQREFQKELCPCFVNLFPRKIDTKHLFCMVWVTRESPSLYWAYLQSMGNPRATASPRVSPCHR